MFDFHVTSEQLVGFCESLAHTTYDTCASAIMIPVFSYRCDEKNTISLNVFFLFIYLILLPVTL